jgi:hypothetical protein
MTRLKKSSCMPKVLSVAELVLWCSKHFDAFTRVIHIGEVGFPLVSMSPLVFQKMLSLLKPNKELKLIETNSFISSNGVLRKIMSQFMDSMLRINPNA